MNPISPDRNLVEATLQVGDENFRLLVEGMKDYAIFMLDPSGQVASWNSGAERTKGYPAEEIIGQHFSRFYTQADIDRGRPDYALKVAAFGGRMEDEGRRVKKDGSHFWANVVITAHIHSDNRELLGFLKITRDLTRSKKDRRIPSTTAKQRFRMLIRIFARRDHRDRSERQNHRSERTN